MDNVISKSDQHVPNSKIISQQQIIEKKPDRNMREQGTDLDLNGELQTDGRSQLEKRY